MRIKVKGNRHASSSLGTTTVTADQRGYFQKVTKYMTDGKVTHALLQFSDNGINYTTEIDNVVCAPNFPFRAEKSTEEKQGYMTLRKGDIGVVFEAMPDKGHAKVTMNGRTGYVALDALMIGTERDNNTYAVEWKKDVDSDPQVKVSPVDPRPNSLLARTIKQLLDTIFNSRDQLQNIAMWFWEMTATDQKREALAKIAVDGFKKAGTYELLKDGVFTLDRLLKIAPDASKAKVQGVYARLYTLVKDRNSALYVGSSFQIAKRMKEHDDYLDKHQNAHAVAFKAAKIKANRDYLVLCNLDDSAQAQADDNVRLVVEQLLVILLGTYNTAAISSYLANNTDRRSANGDLIAAVGDMAEMEDFEEDDSVRTDGLDEPVRSSAMSRFIRDRAAKTSLALAKLGREVCKKCGWQPITTRKSSNGKFGSDVSSLNWCSPIDSIANRPPITKVEMSSMTIYRKAPAKVVQATGVIRVGDIGSHNTQGVDHYFFNTSRSDGPPVGSQVRLVFEVTHNGRPHPHAYARLPRVSIYNDAARAMTLGIRVEWQDSGVDKTVYIMTSHKAGFHSEGGAAMLNSHGLAIGILDYLENREIVQNKRDAVRRFRRALMYEIRYDHYARLIRIEQRTEVTQKVNDDVGIRSAASVNQDMRAVGARNVGAPHGTKLKTPRKSETGHTGIRTVCDRCMAARTYFSDVNKYGKIYTAISGRFMTCEKGAGDVCKNCQAFGVQCSFTVDVMEKPALLQALWFPPIANNDVLDVEDPEIEQLMNRLDMGQGSEWPQSPTRQAPELPGSPSANVPVRWQKPQLRKSPNAPKSEYSQATFGGNVPASVPNHEMANNNAAELVDIVCRPRFNRLVSDMSNARARESITNIFRGMGRLYLVTRGRNLLLAADWLAQKVEEATQYDLWRDNSEENL